MLNILTLYDKHEENTASSNALSDAIGAVLHCNNIKYKITEYKIAFNIFIKLPYFMLRFFPRLPIKNKSYNQLKLYNETNILITCNKRLSLIAKLIPKIYNNNVKNISIYEPVLSCKLFDAILLPNNKKNIKIANREKNIVLFDGIIEKYRNDNKDIEKLNTISKFGKPYISIIINSNTKEYAINFVKTINLIAKNMNTTLLILASKSYSAEIIEKIKQIVDCNYYLYEYKKPLEQAIYYTFLSIADSIIIYSKNIKHIYKSCNFGHTYVYSDRNKLTYQVTKLQKDNKIKIIDKTTDRLPTFSPSPLNDIQDIAKRCINYCHILTSYSKS